MNDKEMNLVAQTIKERDNYIITAHVKPEGDSIGSQLAMGSLLKDLKKNYIIVDQDVVPDNIAFLECSKDIKHVVPDDFHPETVIFLDCPVKERAGSVIKDINEGLFTINIDHHVSNEYYSDINWVETDISSVGEMMYHLFCYMGCALDEKAAQAIYTAIITDTGMFNYNNTSSNTHRVAAELIDKGIVPGTMYSAIYEGKSADQLKILSKVLGSLVLVEDGKIAYIKLTKEMLEEEGIETFSTEELINYPRSIKGVEVAVFFNENVAVDDSISISFRSTGDVDVNNIASGFGGGGHKKASGCYLACSLDKAVEKVIARVKEEL